jgi:hypothetical protein
MKLRISGTFYRISLLKIFDIFILLLILQFIIHYKMGIKFLFNNYFKNIIKIFQFF